jgi:ABC-2 type transport system ATP-binding protein
MPYRTRFERQKSEWMTLAQAVEHVASVEGYPTEAQIEQTWPAIWELTWEEISGGFKLRFVLARELLTEPRVLILDEPLAHLDVESQFDLLDIIKTISTRPKQPITVVLTSQHLYETERFCTKVVVLREGKLVVQGPLNSLSSIHGSSSFELETDSDPALLIGFAKQRNLRIRARPPIYLITSDDPLNINQLIDALASSQIRIKSIRDISSSTRFFFKDSEQAF